ncbi:hypothetical protein X559_2609 [Paenilisteria newyorkensis]|nr:hypothetical protein X559_2609 [Listeria newyorkensis]
MFLIKNIESTQRLIFRLAGMLVPCYIEGKDIISWIEK